MVLQELEQEKKEAEEAKKKARQKSLLGFLNGTGSGKDNDEGSVEFSLAGLFKIMLCTHPKSVDEKHKLLRIAESLDSLSRRLETIERFVDLRLPRICKTYIPRFRVESVLHSGRRKNIRLQSTGLISNSDWRKSVYAKTF